MRPDDAFYNIVLVKIISLYIALGKKTGVELFQPAAIKSIRGAFWWQDFIVLFVFKSIKNEFFFPYRHALFPLFLKSRGRRKLFLDCIVIYAFAFFGTTEGNL